MPAAAWTLIGSIGELFIKMFLWRRQAKQKALKQWRTWVESRQNAAKLSADLRAEHRRQREELAKYKKELQDRQAAERKKLKEST